MEDDPLFEDVIALVAEDLGLTKPEEETSDPDKDDDNNEEDSGTDDGIDWDDLEVGMKVLVDFEEDGKVECEIGSLPKGNKNKIQVIPDDTKEPEIVTLSDILQIIDSDNDGGEYSKGDEVQFKKGRKLKKGLIKSVDDDKEVAKVKVPGDRALYLVDFDDLAHLTD